MNTRHRHRMMIAGTAIATAILMSLSAPAWADDADKADLTACWVQADTGTTRCYADVAAMRLDEIRVTGAPLIQEGTLQARLAAGPEALAAGDFLIARFYKDAGWSGGTIDVSATSSTFCTTGGVISKATMQSGWNDAISSLHTWYNCVALLYDNTNFGSLMGTYTNPSSLGAVNDRTSSYKVQ